MVRASRKAPRDVLSCSDPGASGPPQESAPLGPDKLGVGETRTTSRPRHARGESPSGSPPAPTVPPLQVTLKGGNLNRAMTGEVVVERLLGSRLANPPRPMWPDPRTTGGGDPGARSFANANRFIPGTVLKMVAGRDRGRHHPPDLPCTPEVAGVRYRGRRDGASTGCSHHRKAIVANATPLSECGSSGRGTTPTSLGDPERAPVNRGRTVGA